MALVVHSDEITNGSGENPGLDFTRVYTNNTTFTRATRRAGYHSHPHVHECEQVNYLISGEQSMFMEGLEYRMRAGTFMIMPTMKVRWGWNRSDGPATLLEVHTPAHAFQVAYPILDESEKLEDLVDTVTRPVALSYKTGDDKMPTAPEDDPWIIHSSDIATTDGLFGFESKFVYGETSGLGIVTIPAGAGVAPRFNYCEQIMYVVAGGLTAHMVGRTWELRERHFWRVPWAEPYWFENKTAEPCELAVVHTPVLDPSTTKAHPLFPDDGVRAYNIAMEGHAVREFLALESLAEENGGPGH